MSTTQKFYTMYSNSDFLSDTYEEAEKKAKIEAKDSRHGSDVYIMQAIAIAQSPIPEIIVTKL